MGGGCQYLRTVPQEKLRKKTWAKNDWQEKVHTKVREKIREKVCKKMREEVHKKRGSMEPLQRMSEEHSAIVRHFKQ